VRRAVARGIRGAFPRGYVRPRRRAVGSRMGVEQLYVHRHRCDPRIVQPELCSKFEMRGACMFPVVSQRQPIGVMAFTAPDPRAGRAAGFRRCT